MNIKQTIRQVPYDKKQFSTTDKPAMNYGFILSKERDEKIVNVHFYVDLFEDLEKTRQIDKLYFIINLEAESGQSSFTDEEYYQLFKKGALLGITQVNIILQNQYESKTLFVVPTDEALRKTFEECKNNVLPEDLPM